MTIRVLLRMMPLICVAIFTLFVFVMDTPLERARELARAETQRFAWTAGLVQCPETWGNMPVSACLSGQSPRNALPPD
ncbi:hypothetical protein [Paracoccus laeviglucosivorans]|uniref:Uncharacterized protein n=1 Tax=Paracoccus laeviglucosivorans TaxID=1197861 RepID=A0A521DW00_9RHOB|nr:hypothetical protein [Paracoccus laeviglucosivorans]SMO75924.1 hypothetical protein SAMN06265221_11037 [Paracoccus laeviglucosivorans]